MKRKSFSFLLVNICGVEERNFVFDAHKLKSSQEAEILVSKYCLFETAIWVFIAGYLLFRFGLFELVYLVFR
ncbi:hypothetical protein DB44_BP00230 [Candidatus Protochlamydia amoebophila]|uniref:Uncharacterized protein n=1 Tax=Candidatus Protochlamydia amoebophila TaxID=362787 RepID=A0A0C1K0Y8_9BACT|nr:hypothetical protein DB44_BP00230 [Candidatus Protochlamydia amoebophila]